MKLSILSPACASVFLLFGTASAQTLESGFKNPPNSARPHTWWHWINGNITKQGITADLEAMKRFGLAGAQIFNVDVGIPPGSDPFMGERWKQDIAWAFDEGRRLGMEIDIHNGAGWSSSGGPWVAPENSMQDLTWSETSLHGPIHFDGRLPQPPMKEGYYRDIACYALKKPPNDTFRVGNIKQKAAFDRGDRIDPDPSSIPADADITKIMQTTVAVDGKVSFSLPSGDWTLIRMGVTSIGMQNHPAPKSGLGLEVDKLSRSALNQFWSGMMATALKENGPVTRTGLIGALIDSYEVGSQNWTPKFREEFMKRRGYDPLPYLPAVTGRVVRDAVTTEKFLWDLRRTVCDLFSDNYYGYMTQLCHEHGLQFSTEGYGNGSFDNLEVNGDVDIPMAEFWVGGGAVETTKMVSSSGHTYGKPVIGAESFTADTQHARWMYDPYSLKALGDRMFSLGINRYIFHRYAMQPWLYLQPGMTMGPWGSNLERTNTWWDQGRAWIRYISRCQYLLQQGRFRADVLMFEGDDGPNDLPLMKGTTFPPGYDYDGCDSRILLRATVDNGQIVLPSGMRYRLLVLPDSTWMTTATAKKIDELVRSGATILGIQPNQSPSLGDNSSDVASIGTALWNGDTGRGKVFTGQNVGDALQSMGIEKDFDSTVSMNWIHRATDSADIYFVANPAYHPVDFTATFRVSGKEPELWNPEDGTVQPAEVWSAEGDRTAVQMHLESAGSVFVVFRQPAAPTHYVSMQWQGQSDEAPRPPVVEIVSARYEAVDGSGGVDVTEKARELLKGQMNISATNDNFGDPTENHVKQLHVVYTLNGRQFTKNIAENDSLDFIPPSADDALPSTTFEDGKLLFWRSGSVEFVNEQGDHKSLSSTPSEKTFDVGWDLTFPPDKGAPATAHFDKLISWPDSDIEGIKYFSGTATYRTTFDAGELDKQGASFWLDLGQVKNFAEVTLNGHAFPTLWKAPFRLDVTKWVNSGQNQLEVKVTNLWPNRLIGDEQYPADAKYNGPIQSWPSWLKTDTKRPPGQRTTFTTWQFFTKDSPLLDSGLIGPVKLRRIPELELQP